MGKKKDEHYDKIAEEQEEIDRQEAMELEPIGEGDEILGSKGKPPINIVAKRAKNIYVEESLN